MSVFVHCLWIVFGFILLIKGADFLVSGASSLAKNFRVPDLTIGLTVVAMGTSAPELVVNLFASRGGDSVDGVDLVFGNIIGSNMFNTFVILGIASVIYPLDVRLSVLRKDLPYSFVSLLVLFLLVNDALFFGGNSALGMVDAIVLVVMFAVFLTHTFLRARRGDDDEEGIGDVAVYTVWRGFFYVLLGIVGLALGGEFAVDHAVKVAEYYEIPGRIVGLTILAVGTSLPELATTSVAAFQRKSDLALGNVMGSNIFNILLVLGVTGVTANARRIPMGYDLGVNWDVLFFAFGMLLLVLFMFTFKSRKIDRCEGVIFLVCYAIYLGFVIQERLPSLPFFH